MKNKPKTSFDLAMERLKAEDRAAGAEDAPLTEKQKKAIAAVRGIATAHLAESEILFKDKMTKTDDPDAREAAEREYQIDRQRINDDCERAVEEIRRGNKG